MAVSDDPSAIAHNPAGLTSLKGTNFYNGICAVALSSKYTSLNGHSEETFPQVFFPPNAFLTSDFGFNSVVFGLGIYSPFGIGGRKWSNTGLTRFASTESLISTAVINPTFAWRVLPQLSLGMGLDVLYSSNSADSMVDQSLLAAAPARVSFKGAGLGVGYNLGLLLFPEEKLSFAFAYRSAISVKHEGTLALGGIAPPLQPLFGGGVFRTDANIVMTFPHKFSWGLAYRPTPKVTLALDLEWFWWSSFKRPTLDLKNEIPAAKLTDSTIAFDWKNSLLLTVGGDYKISDRFSLRGGYVFQQTPVPESTLSPGNPDSDQHYLSVGFGYRPGKWVIDGFYAIGFFLDRKVQNPILTGTYHSLSQLGGLSLGYRF